MARLIIVDHQDLVRAGLAATLSNEPDLEVVGEAADGREALALCRETRPDLVLMELAMREMDGLDATRRIKRRFPEVKVLILTLHKDPYCMYEAIQSGADGYILKDAPCRQLPTVIRAALRGEVALTRNLANQLLLRLIRDAPAVKALPVNERERPAEALTPREQAVLGLLSHGLTNYVIGRKLTISAGTVKNHVRRIKAKLEASDRTQAVVRGFELGLIKLFSVPKAG